MTSPTEPGSTANVIGVGLIGGSIGMALRARGWKVFGSDADDTMVTKALELGALDAIGLDAEAAITFVATPVRSIAAAVQQALAAGCRVVTDAGSVKGPIVEAVADARFVGGHPMAGSEQEGVEGADPELFEGAVWVLTPTSDTADSVYTQVAAVVSSFGAEVVALPPERHDALVAVVSHVPHLTAATLMGVAETRAEEHQALLRLAAGGFRDMTRIASGHPAIWPDICRREPRRDRRGARRPHRWAGRHARCRGERGRGHLVGATGVRARARARTCRAASLGPRISRRSASRCPTGLECSPRSRRWPPSWA